MAMERLDPAVEQPFRTMLGHAARGEIAELDQALDGLTDRQLAACAGIAMLVAGYLAIDVSDGQWPTEANLRKMARGTANTGELVKKTGLTEQEAYDFITRVALRSEPIEKIFTDSEKAIRIPFVVTAHFIGTYARRELSIWEFLDQVEDAIETAWAMDLNVLPALVLRSRMPTPAAQPPDSASAKPTKLDPNY